MRLPDITPVCVPPGVNTTPTVQLAFVTSVLAPTGQAPALPVPLIVKAPPDDAMLLMVSGAVPVFETVTVCGSEDLLCAAEKLRAVALTVSCGATAVPVSVIVCTPAGSLVETVIVAGLVPVLTGANFTLNTQPATGIRLLVQVFVCV